VISWLLVIAKELAVRRSSHKSRAPSRRTASEFGFSRSLVRSDIRSVREQLAEDIIEVKLACAPSWMRLNFVPDRNGFPVRFLAKA
jgi:hypothetical protein